MTMTRRYRRSKHKPWALVSVGRGSLMPPAYHVKPIDDEIEHQLDRWCWCNPTEHAENIYVHHSADGREQLELDALYAPARRH